MRQDVGCGPGWAVLKKRGRPGRGQSSWLRDDPFYDLLLVEEQLQAGLVQPHPRWLELEECQGKGQRCLQRPGVGGRPGSRELGGGGVEGGEQTAKKPSALPLTSHPGLSIGVSLCCVFLEGRWHAERET